MPNVCRPCGGADAGFRPCCCKQADNVRSKGQQRRLIRLPRPLLFVGGRRRTLAFLTAAGDICFICTVCLPSTGMTLVRGAGCAAPGGCRGVGGGADHGGLVYRAGLPDRQQADGHRAALVTLGATGKTVSGKGGDNVCSRALINQFDVTLRLKESERGIARFSGKMKTMALLAGITHPVPGGLPTEPAGRRKFRRQVVSAAINE